MTWVEILDIVPFCVTGHALFARLRENREIVSRLLKVVETQIWAQNDRNIQVYISTYNKPKL